ncbi:DUF4249 family protein [Chitinophaga sp.]|uniref:DUF4249 family protein n=1 Tax=Chitinophaga sp. TaxID=1869181 RepID=UPI0031DC39A9
MKTNLIALAILLLASCTKTIDVNLRTAASQIVIQGNITNQGSPYYIKINKSVSFDAENIYPAVSGATVSVLDSNTNRRYYFTESGDEGYYINNNMYGQVGHTYKLSVIVDGTEYTASSTMPDFVGLDEVTFTRTKIFNQVRNLPQVNFTDPAGVTNYYVFTLLVNSVPYKAFYALDDRLTDGNNIRQQLYMDSAYIQPNDFVTVVMGSVDKNVYNYFNVLQGNGGASGTTPSNPPSNISNNALGYFSAECVDIKSITF